MSAAVSELERHGLVAQAGVNQGGIGRTSVSYGLGEHRSFPRTMLAISAGFSTDEKCPAFATDTDVTFGMSDLVRFRSTAVDQSSSP
jgi:hypothetical protein